MKLLFGKYGGLKLVNVARLNIQNFKIPRFILLSC